MVTNILIMLAHTLTHTHTHVHTHAHTYTHMYSRTHTHTHTDPGWSDIKFGVFICIECSGIHRGLGAHLAQVKSLALDEFSDENVTVSPSSGLGWRQTFVLSLQQMTELGNKRASETWEACVPDCCKHPSPKDNL